MAGSSSNWFRPTSGPLAGKAVYIDKNQRAGFSDAQVLKGLNLGTARSMAAANKNRPAGAARPMSDYAKEKLARTNEKNYPRLAQHGNFAVIRAHDKTYMAIDTRTGDKVGQHPPLKKGVPSLAGFRTKAGAVNATKKADLEERRAQAQRAKRQAAAAKPSVGQAEYNRRQHLVKQAQNRLLTLEHLRDDLVYGRHMPPGTPQTTKDAYRRNLSPTQQRRAQQFERLVKKAEAQHTRRYRAASSVKP